MSASNIVQYGPASTLLKSATTIPESGPDGIRTTVRSTASQCQGDRADLHHTLPSSPPDAMRTSDRTRPPPRSLSQAAAARAIPTHTAIAERHGRYEVVRRPRCGGVVSTQEYAGGARR